MSNRRKFTEGQVVNGFKIVRVVGRDKKGVGQLIWLVICPKCRTEFSRRTSCITRFKSCGCYSGYHKKSPIRQHYQWIADQRAAGLSWKAIHALRPNLAKDPAQLSQGFWHQTKRQKAKLKTGARARKELLTATTHALTEEGLSTKDIADRLQVEERTVTRYRSQSGPVSEFVGDFEKVRRLRMFEGLTFQNINRLVGHPYKSAMDLELAFNRECDLRAGLFSLEVA